MSTSQERIDKRIPSELGREIYTPPLLTRCGTVEELTQTDGTATGSGIPTDFSTES